MRKFQTIAVIAGLLFSLTASAQNQQTPKVTNKIEPLPRDLEIQLALSTLPPHLRDNATLDTIKVYRVPSPQDNSSRVGGVPAER
jgi:hypothetical protein